jgi:hypothetical protein
MASAERVVAPKARRHPVRRRLPLLLIAGPFLLLTTGCASSLGYKTPCSVWVSMDTADQQGTMVAIAQQAGYPAPSSEGLSDALRLASAYCADPLLPDDTIGGMRDSRPGT